MKKTLNVSYKLDSIILQTENVLFSKLFPYNLEFYWTSSKIEHFHFVEKKNNKVEKIEQHSSGHVPIFQKVAEFKFQRLVSATFWKIGTWLVQRCSIFSISIFFWLHTKLCNYTNKKRLGCDFRICNCKLQYKKNIKSKNRATLYQPCTDFSKSGGEGCFQLAVTIWIPPLFEKSVHAWSNVARFFIFQLCASNFLGYNPTNTDLLFSKLFLQPVKNLKNFSGLLLTI